jgi:valyl-tRNA synthetase
MAIFTVTEKQRLQKEYEKAEQEYIKIQERLNNPQFVANAPEKVIIKDRARTMELFSMMEKLKARF